jgi:PTS system maltose and glucose-specific IIC component
VIAGIIVWMLHERFHNIRLPDALAFFGGTRFVPIITTVVLGLVGLVIPLIWPVFAMGINALGHVINSAGDFGPMIFGTGERLLLPFRPAPYSGGADPLYRSGRHHGRLRP